MRRYFKTKESAQKHLEIRRKAALKRISKKGHTFLRDDSHVYFDCLYKGMWTTMLIIYTKEMLEDLENFKSFDVQEEELKILKSVEIHPEIIKQLFNIQ